MANGNIKISFLDTDIGKMLTEINSELKDISPEVASEIDGDISCFYCGAPLYTKDSHDKDCTFIKIKEVAEILNRRSK